MVKMVEYLLPAQYKNKKIHQFPCIYNLYSVGLCPCEICRVGRKKGYDKKFVSPYISPAKSEVETYMDPGITDDNFDDWLDLDGEENFPLQAEAAAFPEPGPSASQARKMDNKSNSNDIGLCRMCLGSFKRGTHKKKDCKKHHRYSNLLAR